MTAVVLLQIHQRARQELERGQKNAARKMFQDRSHGGIA